MEEYKSTMQKTFNSFAETLKSIRTGRVNIDFFNSVMVNVYGSKTSITQTGNVSILDSQRVSITIYDASIVKDALKGLQESNLVSNCSANGNTILATIPPMTEERRNDILKGLGKTAEEYKIRIRNMRKDWKVSIDKMEKNKEISEDESRRLLDEMQKETDQNIVKIEKTMKQKESEFKSI